MNNRLQEQGSETFEGLPKVQTDIWCIFSNSSGLYLHSSCRLWLVLAHVGFVGVCCSSVHRVWLGPALCVMHHTVTFVVNWLFE